MSEFENNVKKEAGILNYFRNLVKLYPQEFVKNMRQASIIERARVLAFLQVRDYEIYLKAQKLMQEVV